MATVAPSSNGEDSLLDLHFLTEEERAKIEKVLREDEELKTRDRIRLGSLRQELEQERNHQKLFIGQNQCACCEKRFGTIFNRGTNCPECFHRVCKQCRRLPYQKPPKFICTVCSKKRLLDLQSVDYMPLLLSSKLKDPPPLYGTELVLKSLGASSASGRSTPFGKPSPLQQQPPKSEWETRSTSTSPLPRPIGSIASSIVVRYDDEESSDTERKSSFAKKVPPSELSDSDEEEEEEKEKKQRHQEPLPSTPKFLKRSDSANSMTSLSSMYSAACGKGDYDITGEVQVGVWYKDGQLFVRVVKARGLAVAKKSGHSDPYIKTYLLPDKSKHTKRKTGIQRKTTNPNYNELLKTKVPQSDLKARTLWLSVWDWDRFGRNQFLGEIHLPLSQLDLTSPEDQWYTLHEKEDSDVESLYRGRLQVGLMFSPRETQRGKRGSRTRGFLHILIKQAEDLPIMDPHGLTDGTVKCYLLPNRSSYSKKKTAVIKNNLNPIWEEQFTYDVTLEELSSERVLEVTVWDYDRRGSNDFIGGLRLGPAPSTHMAKHKEWMDSIEEEVSHWEAMLSRPGEWVEEWHVLRPSMDPLGAISDYKPPLPPSKSARPPELSPVQEASPTRELSSAEGQLPTLEMYSFTPPPPPEASSTPDITQPQPVSSSSGDVPRPPSSGDVPRIPPSDEVPRPPPSDEVPRPPSSVASEEGFQRTSPAPPTPTIVVTEEVEDKSKKQHSELLKYHDDASFGSMTSIYSDAGGGKGDYDITGEVLVAVYFKDGHLLVHVNRAKGLAAADSNGLSDPYIKTYLLPDKSKYSKKKTTIKRKTLNPVYNETLKYKVPHGDLHSRTLWLSVWDWDRFGRNQFLGEVRLPLSQLDLNDTSPNWFILQDKDESGEGHKDVFSRGELKLGMMFSPTETKKGKTIGTLTIVIKQARDLPNMDSKGLTDAFVKCYLLPDKSSHSKRKTGVVKNNLNPVWEERFSYEKVNLEELLRERVMEVTVWDLNRGSSNDFIGGLRLGPTPGRASRHKEWMDSIGEEVSHWESMLSQPGKWVEQWHTLRSSMDPRDIDLSSCPPPEPSLPSTLVEEFPTTRSETTKQGLAEESLFGAKITIVGTKETELLKPKAPEVIPSEPTPVAEPLPSENEPQVTEPKTVNGLQDYVEPTKLRRSSPVVTETTARRPKKKTTPSPPISPAHETSKQPHPTPPPPTIEEEFHKVLTTHHQQKMISDEKSPSESSSLDSGSRGSPQREGEVWPPVVQSSLDAGSRGSPQREGEVWPQVVQSSRGSPRSVPTVAVATATSSHESLESQENDTLASLEGPSPLQKTGLLKLQHHSSASSFGSMTSIYSDAGGGKGDYDITGEVLVAVYFKDGHLLVHVNRAKGLAAADSNGLSDPYIKTYLLPDKSKHSKKKTTIKRKTLNPVYNETLKYKVPHGDLHSRTLWLSVWDWDRFGRNQFLGEVRLPLSQHDLNDTNDRWYILQDREDTGGTEAFYRGQLKLGMLFSPTETKKGKTKGTLTIVIKQARDLPNMDSKGLTDAFVKCYLLPDKSSHSKRKTGVIKNNLNPVWEERFSYEKVNLEELSRERVMEVTVWDLNRGSSNDFIGGLRLGPTPGRASRHKEWMDSIGDEVSHWESMLSQPGKWVEQWHTLRTTMDPRSVALE